MPGRPGKKNIGSNIREASKGKTVARTRRKYGAKRARAQAIAIGISESKRRSKKRKRR